MILELVDRRRQPDPRLTGEQLALLLRVCALAGRHEWSCDLVLADDAEVADLNAKFRRTDGVTDVLSFSYLTGQGEGPPALAAGVGYARQDLWRDPCTDTHDATVGEVVLAPSFVMQRCRGQGWPYLDEIALLTVHGVLHVLGWTHATTTDRKAMQELEQELLTREGIAHPILKGEIRN